MTQIKICGIQESDDAEVAARAGADFIGLVFVPGRRRRLDEDRALSIVSTLREKEAKITVGTREPLPLLVGLFSDQPLRDVDHIVRQCGLDMVQLCGSESLEYCGQVGVPVIKVLHVPDSLEVEDQVVLLAHQMESICEQGHLITLDRKVEGLQGGTGQGFNWDIARSLSTRGFSFLLGWGSDASQRGPGGTDNTSSGSRCIQWSRDGGSEGRGEDTGLHPGRPNCNVSRAEVCPGPA